MTDWILRGGEVVDGSGRPRRAADVAITGDRIAAVGVVAKVTGAREIDVAGKIVAPGFIDVHTHDDRSEEHTSELQSRFDLVCRLLLEKKKQKTPHHTARRQVELLRL